MIPNNEPRTTNHAPLRLKAVSCEVFTREVCWAIARSPHEVDVEFLPKGLHDLGAARMFARVREVVERIDERPYDAIVMAYGLCNNGLAGLRARTIPLVLPRAHDCITLFLGSKERYLEQFNANPATYYLTSGWIERSAPNAQLSQFSIKEQAGMNMTREELVEKYGEDNADFLWEELVNHAKHYNRLGFIEMGVEPDGRFEAAAQARAGERQWRFEKLAGDLTLLRRLIDGEWNPEDFLVVPPAHRVVVRHDARIVDAEPVGDEA
ncbi:MAG: DUF1638 domain-containing protein [Candidatus Sumerlaeia bacterium]|nr:DUF1638 domain-containing protein [Candidatus Sumerlaeia bacterium]